MNRPGKFSPSGLDRIFGALADPTRREVLDALREREAMTAGEIAALFPAISRPAVSKHLRVLRDAGLVGETRTGRHIVYRIPEYGIAQEAERWLEPFQLMLQNRLGNLKRFVETGESQPET